MKIGPNASTEARLGKANPAVAVKQPSGLLKSAAVNSAGQIIALATGIALTPLIVSRLGTTGYAIWALVVALQGLVGVVDFGVTGSAVRFVAAHHARNDIGGLNRVVSTLFCMHLALGSLAGLIGVGFAFWGLPLLNISAADQAEARSALIVAAIGLAVAMPLGVLGNVLIGIRHYVESNVVTVGQAILTSAATAIALLAGGGVTVVIAIGSIGLAASHGTRAILAVRRLPGARWSVRLANRATLREVSAYSVWLFLIDAAVRLFYNIDAVVISAFLTVSTITDYNLGFKAASAVGFLAASAVSVLLPTAAAYAALDQRDRLAHVMATCTRLACAATMPGAIWLALWGAPVIKVWVGPGHSDAVPIIWLFLGVFFAISAQSSAATALKALGRVRSLAGVVGLEYVVNVALSVTLVSHIGAKGAAVGTLVPSAIAGLVVIPWLAGRELALGYGRFVRLSILPPLIAAVPATAFLVFLRWVLPQQNLLAVLLAGLGTVMVYGASYVRLAAVPEEREALLSAVARMRKPVGRHRHRP